MANTDDYTITLLAYQTSHDIIQGKKTDIKPKSSFPLSNNLDNKSFHDLRLRLQSPDRLDKY